MTESSDKGFEFVKQLGKELDEGNLRLPTFPDVALRVRKIVNDPNSDINKIVTVVQAEPVLTARLLKMANSALMRRGVTQIVDLRSAIGRLGFDMVKNAAMAVAMQQILTAKAMGSLRIHLNGLWKHSVEVAAISYVLAKYTKAVPPEQALLAGLLHDIGKYYILMRADEHPELFSDEQVLEELLHTWHPGISRAILEAWNFSDEFLKVADEHENLEREIPGSADLVDVVMLANLHANIGKKHTPKVWAGITALQRLKLDPESSIELMRESRDEVKSIASALNT